MLRCLRFALRALLRSLTRGMHAQRCAWPPFPPPPPASPPRPCTRAGNITLTTQTRGTRQHRLQPTMYSVTRSKCASVPFTTAAATRAHSASASVSGPCHNGFGCNMNAGREECVKQGCDCAFYSHSASASVSGRWCFECSGVNVCMVTAAWGASAKQMQ